MSRRIVYAAFGMAVLLSANVMVVATSLAQAQPSLYGRIVRQAATGNPEAQEALLSVQTFLQRKGLASPPREGVFAESVMVNGVTLHIKGVAPFYIKGYNTPEFVRLAELDEYINKRKGSLSDLAAMNP